MPKGLALTINYGEEKALVLALRAEDWVSTCLWGEEFPLHLLSCANNFGDGKKSRGEHEKS